MKKAMMGPSDRHPYRHPYVRLPGPDRRCAACGWAPGGLVSGSLPKKTDPEFKLSIEIALGRASEDELRHLIERYTGVKLSLGECNRLSQDIAEIVITRYGLGY